LSLVAKSPLEYEEYRNNTFVFEYPSLESEDYRNNTFVFENPSQNVDLKK
jgi:hypothetical protein